MKTVFSVVLVSLSLMGSTASADARQLIKNVCNKIDQHNPLLWTTDVSACVSIASSSSFTVTSSQAFDLKEVMGRGAVAADAILMSGRQDIGTAIGENADVAAALQILIGEEFSGSVRQALEEISKRGSAL